MGFALAVAGPARRHQSVSVTVASWFILAGVVLTAMALVGSVLKRLPLSASTLYLLLGFGLGRLGLFTLEPDEAPKLVEHVTEVAVLISLFTAGLKLRVPLADRQWRVVARLAVVGMVCTVAGVALAGVLGLGLGVGAAVLLGGILSPTDPVLASDVQVENPWDRDRLRFALTGEAGLNDGAAFPVVMLGLGLCGLHPLGDGLWRWLTLDVLWAVAGGLLIGAALGRCVGMGVLYLRRTHREAVGLDDFLALGLVGLAYGLALAAHAYGFLAVFAAGLALRRIEVQESGAAPEEEIASALEEGKDEELATHPDRASAYMAHAVLGFNQQLERIAEVFVVMLLGVLLADSPFPPEVLWMAPLLFLVIRPAAVSLSLVGTQTSWTQRALVGWFGIRGVGSLYYLFFAISHGLPGALTGRLSSLTLYLVAVSIVLHGTSVTPLMRWYSRGRSTQPKTPGTSRPQHA